MKKDLTGQKFGMLTALEPAYTDPKRGVIWRCLCECGTEKEIPTNYLMRGQNKSCGCAARGGKRRQDITGQTFGRLTAVSFSHYNENHMDCWLFRCACGKEIVMPAANVKWKGTQSCGCLRSERLHEIHSMDLTGQRFGRLTALQSTEERDSCGSILWECVCDCGTHVCYSVSNLNSGNVQSCGCLLDEYRARGTSNRSDALENTNIGALIGTKQLHKNNTSGCTGVCYNQKRQKWQAYIDFQKKRYFLGVYDVCEDAVNARKKAERALHDPFITKNLDFVAEETREKFQTYLLQLTQA